MLLQLNCRYLPPSKEGSGTVVLVRVGKLGPMERDRWEREPPDERLERVRSMSEDSISLVGAAGGTGVEHVGQLHGPASGCMDAAVASLVARHAQEGNPTSVDTTATN